MDLVNLRTDLLALITDVLGVDVLDAPPDDPLYSSWCRAWACFEL